MGKYFETINICVSQHTFIFLLFKSELYPGRNQNRKNTVRVHLYKILVRAFWWYSDGSALQRARLLFLSLLCLFSLSVSTAHWPSHSFSLFLKSLPFLSDFRHHVCSLLNYLIFKTLFCFLFLSHPGFCAEKWLCVTLAQQSDTPFLCTGTNGSAPVG